MASPQTVRPKRRVRPVRLCAPDVLVEHRPDGTIYLALAARCRPIPRS